jgi:hypothetical protein
MEPEQDTIGADARVCRHPRVAYRDLEEGGVLLHLESGAYHGVNPTGCAIWKLLEGEPRLRDLLERLRARLEDPPPNLHEEVLLFLEGLRDRDLVRVREA